MSRKLTTAEFISKSKQSHVIAYDYSISEYTGVYGFVDIICPQHGVFSQRAGIHMNGSDCPQCAFERRGEIISRLQCERGSETFVKKAIAVHGDEYAYDRVVYIDSKTAVEIVCSKHGSFWQTPNTHLKGHGCPRCWAERLTFMNLSDTKSFIIKAKNIHGDKYDYSKVSYMRSNVNVIITCPTHGDFEMTPQSHLNGRGCRMCGLERMQKAITKSVNEFIDNAVSVHGDLYDYSLVEYISSKTPVRIVCRQHGVFLQRPNNHLSGAGCPKCKSSMLESMMEAALLVKGLSFVSQKTFDWLRNDETGYPLYLDFYCDELGIAIECQGPQHFEPIDFFGGKESFESLRRRDILKKELCAQHGISILYLIHKRVNKPFEENEFEDADMLIAAALYQSRVEVDANGKKQLVIELEE